MNTHQVRDEFFNDIDTSEFTENDVLRKQMLFDESEKKIFPLANKFNTEFYKNMYCHALRKGYNVVVLGVSPEHPIMLDFDFNETLKNNYNQYKVNNRFYFGTDRESENKYLNLYEYLYIRESACFYITETLVHINFHIPKEIGSKNVPAAISAKYSKIVRQRISGFLYFGSFYDKNET